MDIRVTDAGRNVKRIQLFVDDEAVSGLYLFDLPMRVGGAVVRMGGIGGVATRKEHRMKGYCRAVMDFTMRYMHDERYDMSVLFGIPNFYYRWGYVTSLVDCECLIRVDGDGCPGALREVRAKHRLRKMRRADIPAVLEIYAKANASRSATIARDPATWRGPRKGSGWQIKARPLVAEQNGKIVGYMFVDESNDSVVCSEAAARDEVAYSSFAAFLARRARALKQETVRVIAPPDDPFAIYLRRFGATFTVRYPLCRAGMACITNFNTLFRKLAAEFTRRARAAGLAQPSSLCVVTDKGAATISFDGRRARVALGERPAQARLCAAQEVLTQMLLGYRGWRDALNDERVRLSGRKAPLGPALFPQGEPFMWPADHF